MRAWAGRPVPPTSWASRRRSVSAWPRRRPFPGVALGATITIGLFLGLRRDEAARFSFLMSVPITTAAALLSWSSPGSGDRLPRCVAFMVGSITSGSSGIWPWVSLDYLTGHSLLVFAYYRFALAAVVVVLLLFGIGGF